MMQPDWDSQGELLWSERVEQRKGGFANQVWSFSSRQRDFQLHVQGRAMQDIHPDGQLVILKLHFRAGRMGLEQCLPIPGMTDRAVAQTQFECVPVGMEFMLRDIWQALQFMPDPDLAIFYRDVLTDERITAPFFRARASQRYHHARDGGLLEHSYEVAEMASSLCDRYGLGPLSSRVGFVAGLFHDLGKIWLYYNGNEERLNTRGQHEAFTFSVLGEHLERLRRASPQVFEALSACLVAKVGGRAEQYMLETIVRHCDRISAEADHQCRLFDNVPAHFWFVREQLGSDNRVIKRLL